MGREIIAPQDLQNSVAALVDSLYLIREIAKKAGNNYWKAKKFGLPFKFLDDNFISFIIDSEQKQKDYYNFYRKNNRWIDIQASNFWKTDADSRNQFYNLLVKKIRQLKDADIDCSNLADLVDRTQKRFLVSEAGITFSFDTRLGYDSTSVVFSWEEVNPFLKMPLF